MEKVNSWNGVSDPEFQLYEALVVGRSGLATEFKPKNLEKLKAQYEREQAQTRTPSNLYQSCKIEPALKALGYDDLVYRGTVDGFISNYYSAKQ